mgnify:CR=1 FL=1
MQASRQKEKYCRNKIPSERGSNKKEEDEAEVVHF